MPQQIAPFSVAVWQGRCPRCGRGKLFHGLLPIRDRCDVCGLDLRESDVGDGPAIFIILALTAILGVLAIWIEFRFSPPLWVHILIWPIVAVAGAIAMSRPLKAALVWSQYRNRSTEMGL